MSPREVSTSIDIDAPVAAVWAAVSDPQEYKRWSPESTGAIRKTGTGPWAVGDRFTGSNSASVKWSTQCRVTAAVQDRRFAFDVRIGPIPIARWAYELESLPGGTTRVTERWTDRRDGILGAIVKPAGLLVGRGYDAAAHNLATMRATLQSLKADLEHD